MTLAAKSTPLLKLTEQRGSHCLRIFFYSID
jgi:hypothetical protein